MADEIVIGSKAIKEVQALRDELLKADVALLKLSQDALQAGRNLSTISTPSGLNASNSNNEKTSSDLDKLRTKYEAVSNAIIKKSEQSRLAEIRLQQQREKAFDSFERNAQKEQALVAKNNNEYNRTQRQINVVTQAYNNLSAKKERYNNLTAFEEKRLSTLQKVTDKYNSTLKNIDGSVGKYSRNVGNYAGQWNGLGNSINQLTREAPAFAVSLNTGFLALSNNIPTLFDELGRLRQANIELAKSGQPTKSIFGQLAGAVLSWQTALSVGVTLLTLYGGTLIDSISGSKKKKEALEAEKKALEEKTKAEQDARDAIANVQAIEVSRSKILLETAKNVSLSYNQRIKAVKELQERYPAYLGHLSREQILAGDTAKAEESLNLALINRGKALAAQTFLQTNLEKQLSLEIEIGKLNEKKFKYDKEALKNGSQIVIYTDQQKKIAEQKRDVERQTNADALNNATARLSVLKREQEAFLLIYNENAKYLDTVKETTKEKKDQAKTSKIESVNQLEINKSQDGALAKLKQLKQALELTRDETGKNATEFEAYNKSIEDVNKAIDVLTKPITVDVKIKGIPDTKKEVKELTQYMQSFINDFSSSTGFSSTFEILQKKVKDFGKDFKTTFNGIAEIAQETFNFINQNSEANFNEEKERLQSQYDVSFKYANGNKEAEEKLAEELEKKKKEIANREAKAKKEQAIYNIIIDTAQAVVASLPNFVLAGLVAALGAVQVAMVSSQKVPQYFKGGIHDGGLMMVNDAKGNSYKETIIFPNGSIAQPEGRNVLMNAPSGTKIYTPEQWDKIEQEKQLLNMLQPRGIEMNAQQTQGFDYQAMDGIMNKYLGNITVEKTVIDKVGFSNYVEKQGSKTKINRNFASSKGFRFS